MKLRYMLSLLLVAAIGATYLVMQNRGMPEYELELLKKKLSKKAARGTKDDPDARARWEFERLKNPATGRIPRGIREKELAFARTLPTRESRFRSGLAKGEKAVQPFTWVKRGPNNVGGRTRAFAADVAVPTTLIAGGVSGGMWRSADDGVTWTKATGASELQSVSCIAQDTRSGQTATWYYGTGEYLGNSASGGGGGFLHGDGIFKSTDSGVSWAKLSNTDTNAPQIFDSFFDYVWRIAIDPSNLAQAEVYAATYGRIYRTTDGGTNWTAVVSSGSPYSYATDVAVTSTGVVYAAFSSGSTISGIRRSTDGVTWNSITPAGFPTSYGRIVLAVAPSNQNVLYFLVEGANGTELVNQINGHQLWKYTYVSGDGSGVGGTWVNKGQTLPNESGAPGNAVFDTQGGYDMTVHVKPDNENFVIIGGVNLYKTADFSVTTPTWTRIGGYATAANYSGYASHHADQHSGFFRTGSSIIFYSGHDGGLTKTADINAGPVVWTKLNTGYVTSQFYTIAIDHGTAGNNVLIGGLQDNGTWWTNQTSPTVAWLSQFGGDGAYCAVADGRASYYVSSQSGNMYRWLLDANGAFVNYANIQPTGASGYLFINPFVLNPNNTNMMYLAGGDRIWRNSDLTGIPTGVDNTTTVNWTRMDSTAVSGDAVVSLAVSKTPADRLYYATYDGIAVARNLYRVNGANLGNPPPTDVTGAGFPSGGYTSCIAVNPANADEVIAVFSNYQLESLFYTTNGGTSWTAVGGNLEPPNDFTGTSPGPSCRWAAIVPTIQGTTYFVATSTGLYSTTTLNGVSTVWAQEGGSVIGSVVVDMIDYRTTDGLVVVATHGNGVFSTNVIVSAPVAENQVPTTYVLEQNFPNPFNPSTTIQYSLPERADVTLAVFDMSGREIARLVNKEQSAGWHEVRWNARDSKGSPVASGVYFYRLTAVGDDNAVKFSKTEKMTYVK